MSRESGAKRNEGTLCYFKVCTLSVLNKKRKYMKDSTQDTSPCRNQKQLSQYSNTSYQNSYYISAAHFKYF
jgi:hypothetical protein